MKRLLAAVILAASCIHEFAWQLLPMELQGDFRAVTQWPLVATLCVAFSLVCKDRFCTAVALTVGIMSSTTAACSLAWLIHPFETQAGEDQCSKVWGLPMLLVSALCASWALGSWSHREQR